mmetsp:Transcript_15356/g.50214  ORF Transcript_15356/g.50214 Transcript_15356/m.50214 type:complete len:236 (-) Transcript_15356:68-775(-)
MIFVSTLWTCCMRSMYSLAAATLEALFFSAGREAAVAGRMRLRCLGPRPWFAVVVVEPRGRPRFFARGLVAAARMTGSSSCCASWAARARIRRRFTVFVVAAAPARTSSVVVVFFLRCPCCSGWNDSRRVSSSATSSRRASFRFKSRAPLAFVYAYAPSGMSLRRASTASTASGRPLTSSRARLVMRCQPPRSRVTSSWDFLSPSKLFAKHRSAWPARNSRAICFPQMGHGRFPP